MVEPEFRRQGFSLIELMIVVVIIGILAAILIPNLASMQDRAREAAVKENAHACQAYVEGFAAKNGGRYPDGIAAHMNGEAGLSNPVVEGDPAVVDGFSPKDWPGSVYYLVDESGTFYEITAVGKDGCIILELQSK